MTSAIALRFAKQFAAASFVFFLASPVFAQVPGGPPVVGYVVAEKKPVTQIQEFIGRIEAVNKVNVVARVSAELEEAPFKEGTEVKKGDILYQLEKPPYEAAVESAKASVDQFRALLRNAVLTTERYKKLLSSPAGQQSSVDSALAQQQSYEAQMLGAQAQQKTAEINLGYTTIRSPIDGKVGRIAVTVGNIVGPTSGTLTTIVSQDPMYVTFPVPSPTLLELGRMYAPKGGFDAVVLRIRLPDGTLYAEKGKLDYVDPSVATNTDTVTVRGTIPNPLRKSGNESLRPLIDGEFVTALVEGVEPVVALAIPRSAVLSDQQGDYVYVISADNVVTQRRIQLGQSTAAVAMISAGLSEGEKVVTEGIQRVRPNLKVAPQPAGPDPIKANGQ
ncbi:MULTISPECIES: efflux RND transporter periplasmic adaptor subunit [unclassified Hyphomicrobium]|uniref:efflux RND transporter periplasmic adaptor subunit n=1 Tax=unclassified Hyphomicrobium TaxID=2619925 RepID=UPI000213F69D|nr:MULTISPECIES: efflux RND transporter periplasmic adaptor subunit [unclassified Hyphomicrobium]CCB64970.1 RND efflux transporter, MFP subunit [Hyphomicrobium sp. MC1]